MTSRRSSGFRAATIIIGLLASTSCSDSTAPPAVPGTYRLMSADGKPLPVRWDTLPGEDPAVFIRSGQLEIIAPDSMRVTMELERRDAAGNVVATFAADQAWFNFQLVGDSLVLDPDIPSYDHGHVHGARVFLFLSYPLPPSSGWGAVTHQFAFLR